MNTDRKPLLTPESSRAYQHTLGRNSEDPHPYYSEPEDSSRSVQWEEIEDVEGPSPSFIFLLSVIMAVALVGTTKICQKLDELSPLRNLWLSSIPTLFVFPSCLLWIKLRSRSGFVTFSLANIMEDIRIASRRYSWRHSVSMVLVSSVLFLGQYYCYVKSMDYTTGGSAIAIFNLAPSAIYVLSIGVLKARVSLNKIFGILLCIGGSLIVCLEDYHHILIGRDDNSWVGDVLAAVSCLLFTVYIVHYNVLVPKPHVPSLALYISTLGLFIFLFAPVLIPLLHFSSVEVWYMPTDGRTWGLTIGLSASILVYNLCLWIGAPGTSPLSVSIANLLAIPMEYLGYLLLEHGGGVTVWFVLGSGLIAVGFIFVNLKSEACARRRDPEVASIN